MSNWRGSDRRERLPANWPTIRKRILKRDNYRCRWRLTTGGRCNDTATDVDHIERGDDHRDENLQSLCEYHHRIKSGQEGAEARAAIWRKNNQKFRRVERHPGLL